jgi:hypothetical protein
MKEFFARLNPLERRFVVGVTVVLFLVVNIVWVWPHFGDWGRTKERMKTAQNKRSDFQMEVAKLPALEREIKKFQSAGQGVPLEDQAIQFFRTIQQQAAASGVSIVSMGNARQVSSTNNPFFVEQDQTITAQSGEKQLVDFLYNLGAGNSLIRVRVLSVQPDPSHQQLVSHITLVASYQKKPAPAKAAAPAAKPAAPAPGPAKPPVGVPPPPLPPRTAPKTLTPTKK